MQPADTRSSLLPAFSPLQKHRYDSGYPSPPSSGRMVHCAAQEEIAGDTGAYAQTQHVDSSKCTIHFPPEGGLVDAEELGASDSECEEEDGHYEEYAEEIGDDTVVPMTRSYSDTSWTDTMPNSSPTTSIASLAQRVWQEPPRVLSPYVDRVHQLKPIRDTPRNPFLEGGPADVGLSGQHTRSRRRKADPPTRERGRMIYVFRGQRVSYPDPYASDSEDDDAGPSTRGGMFDRLQPKLLFPSAGKITVRPCQGDLFEAARAAVAMQRATSSHCSRQLSVSNQEKESIPERRSAHSDLLAKLDRAGWSDDDDDDEEEEGQQLHFAADRAWRKGNFATQEEEDEYDEIMDDDNDDENRNQIEDDDNPFRETTATVSQHAPASTFLHRLRQMQTDASASEPTDLLSSKGQRYRPYDRPPRGHVHSHAHPMHVPNRIKGRAR